MFFQTFLLVQTLPYLIPPPPRAYPRISFTTVPSVPAPFRPGQRPLATEKAPHDSEAAAQGLERELVTGNSALGSCAKASQWLRCQNLLEEMRGAAWRGWDGMGCTQGTWNLSRGRGPGLDHVPFFRESLSGSMLRVGGCRTRGSNPRKTKPNTKGLRTEFGPFFYQREAPGKISTSSPGALVWAASRTRRSGRRCAGRGGGGA